jgi:REP element-mobilizing transposase RayT
MAGQENYYDQRVVACACRGDPVGRPSFQQNHQIMTQEMFIANATGAPNQRSPHRVAPTKNRREHDRKSVRLPFYDYSRHGGYFITICAFDGLCLFGEINDGKVTLNKTGKIIQSEWLQTEQIRKNVKVDLFVVMPNHFHGIVIIRDAEAPRLENDYTKRATHRVAPTQERQAKIITGSISAIIGQFKPTVTKRVRSELKLGSHSVWQRGFYEHVIRNEKELNRVRQYILGNPAKWSLDRENRERSKTIKVDEQWMV